jgi:hypothetical protein
MGRRGVSIVTSDTLVRSATRLKMQCSSVQGVMTMKTQTLSAEHSAKRQSPIKKNLIGGPSISAEMTNGGSNARERMNGNVD